MSAFLPTVKKVCNELKALKGAKYHALNWSEVAEQFSSISRKSEKALQTEIAWHIQKVDEKAKDQEMAEMFAMIESK
jgi:hypothetical protein